MRRQLRQHETGCANGAGNGGRSRRQFAAVDRMTGRGGVKGVCTHICRHGGRKIFRMGTDDTQVIRIEAGVKIGVFKPECVNNLVRVTSTQDGRQTGREANWRQEGSRLETDGCRSQGW